MTRFIPTSISISPTVVDASSSFRRCGYVYKSLPQPRFVRRPLYYSLLLLHPHPSAASSCDTQLGRSASCRLWYRCVGLIQLFTYLYLYAGNDRRRVGRPTCRLNAIWMSVVACQSQNCISLCRLYLSSRLSVLLLELLPRPLSSAAVAIIIVFDPMSFLSALSPPALSAQKSLPCWLAKRCDRSLQN